jgi:hypothetical protein
MSEKKNINSGESGKLHKISLTFRQKQINDEGEFIDMDQTLFFFKHQFKDPVLETDPSIYAILKKMISLSEEFYFRINHPDPTIDFVTERDQEEGENLELEEEIEPFQ